jgi:hypothetical protein
MSTAPPRSPRGRRLVRLRGWALSVGIAALVPVVMAAAGWAAFLTLERASPDELMAARALGHIDKIRLVDSVIHLQGRTLRGKCLSGRFMPFGARHPVQGEFLSLSNGRRSLDVGHGPQNLVGYSTPPAVLQAEWMLAGCPSFLRRMLGRRLSVRLPVSVQPALRGTEQLLRIPLPVGSPTTAYFFQPVTGRPRRMEYAGHGVSGWSELHAARASRRVVRRLVALSYEGQAAHRLHD